MLGVVLMNRELSDSFAMLAGLLTHAILVLIRHSKYSKTLSLGYLLGVTLSWELDNTSWHE